MIRHRPEVDGLRAIAVVPVVLFHTGWTLFRGGFVGVDVFFVISGYLITSIILADFTANRFSLLAFYERRIRRILPALFVVMGTCCILAYSWMLPKDLESFGKSLIATSLFSNNILELHSGGYWALPAQFKPLLTTWSLGVEEQFYVVYPLLLIAMLKRFGQKTIWVLATLSVCGMVCAELFIPAHRAAVFYLFPTRSWELLLGALVAFRRNVDMSQGARAQGLSALGFFMILSSVFLFDRSTPTPGLLTLVPTGGAALVLLYARQGTVAHRILTTPALVAVGLMSYSLYLWHFPVFAFARIYSVQSPSPSTFGALLLVIVPLSYLSWRFIETPARSKALANRTVVFAAAAVISLAFVGYGYYLYRTRGVPTRLDPNGGIATDDMYIEYNASAFRFKKDVFDKARSLRVLVLGNSFARDFINMTVETFDLRWIDIVYRDDLDDCLSSIQRPTAVSLLQTADVIVLASRSANHGCVAGNLEFAEARGKKLFYVGTKYFGVNLNWLMRLDPQDRRSQFNPLPSPILREENEMSRIVPPHRYISLLAPIMRDGFVPITDAEGRLISPDRTHLTRYGAQFIGRRALADSAYGTLLKSY